MLVKCWNDSGVRASGVQRLVQSLRSSYEKRPASASEHEGWHFTCSNSAAQDTGVRIRITHRPREHDVEGVSLDSLRPGSVCDVSAALGSWLIVQGYADPEMRRTQEDGRARERRRTRTGLPDRRRK